MCKIFSHTSIIVIALLFLPQTGNSQSFKWEITNLHALTDSSVSLAYYEWSPDGQKIAISGRNLYVIENEPGVKPIFLDDNLGASGIQWSPDSKRIVYITKKPDKGRMKGAQNISEGYRWSAMVADVDSQKTEEIAYNNFGFGNPEWHNDGEIVLVKSQTHGEVINISKWKGKNEKKGRDLVSFKFINGKFQLIRNGEETDFIMPPGMIDVSNNGKFMATKGKGGLTILNLDPPYTEKGYGHHIATPSGWSQDDKYILCVEEPGGEQVIKGERGNLFIFTIADGNIQNLTAMHIVGEENMVGFLYPKFSPDGKQISFICHFFKGPSKLYIADLLKH
jgi:dipeptidyl aminopeptidase/acylaminoacyl peptidase